MSTKSGEGQAIPTPPTSMTRPDPNSTAARGRRCARSRLPRPWDRRGGTTDEKTASFAATWPTRSRSLTCVTSTNFSSASFPVAGAVTRSCRQGSGAAAPGRPGHGRPSAGSLDGHLGKNRPLVPDRDPRNQGVSPKPRSRGSYPAPPGPAKLRPGPGHSPPMPALQRGAVFGVYSSTVS